MFNHIMLGSNDMERSKKFYDALVGSLGGKPGHTDAKGRVIYSHDGGVLMLSKPIDGGGATHANGGTVGFKAKDEAQLHAWHKAGVENGGHTCEDPPGQRPAGMFLAYLRDPDNNKLCAVYRPAA